MATKILGLDGKPIVRNGKEVYQANSNTSLVEVKGVDFEKRQLTIVGTDETRDRDGDIIRMKGWELENFLKNPVMFWAHNYSSVPIAFATKLIRKGNPKRMIFVEQFPTAGLYDFADMILALFQEQVIRASSVGFIPMEWKDIQPEESNQEEAELRRRPSYGREFMKQELLELSACGVPSNPSALVVNDMVKSFFDDEKSLEQVSLALEKETGTIPKPKSKQGVLAEFHELQHKGIELIDESENKVFQVPGQRDIGDAGNEFPIPDEIAGAEVIRFEDVEKPYANEHACRIADPKGFDKFARKNCHIKVDDKCVDVIFGIKSGKASIQAYRYPKDSWTAAKARSHCKGHEGSFEAASENAVDVLAAYEYLQDVIQNNIPIFDPDGKISVDKQNEIREVFSTEKIGAVLSMKNKKRLTDAKVAIDEVLQDAEREESPGEAGLDPDVSPEGVESDSVISAILNEEPEAKATSGNPDKQVPEKVLSGRMMEQVKRLSNEINRVAAKIEHLNRR